jgi:hypothetical protein
MLKLSIQCTRFKSNYPSCTGTSSENICSSSEGAQGKGKAGWNLVYHQTKTDGKTSFGSSYFVL